MAVFIGEIKAHTENPNCAVNMPHRWAKFEYDKGRGSMNELVDYATRYGLLFNLSNDSTQSDEAMYAWAYLLKIEI